MSKLSLVVQQQTRLHKQIKLLRLSVLHVKTQYQIGLTNPQISGIGQEGRFGQLTLARYFESRKLTQFGDTLSSCCTRRKILIFPLIVCYMRIGVFSRYNPCPIQPPPINSKYNTLKRQCVQIILILRAGSGKRGTPDCPQTLRGLFLIIAEMSFDTLQDTQR